MLNFEAFSCQFFMFSFVVPRSALPSFLLDLLVGAIIIYFGHYVFFSNKVIIGSFLLSDVKLLIKL